jgi:hypothetical protein
MNFESFIFKKKSELAKGSQFSLSVIVVGSFNNLLNIVQQQKTHRMSFLLLVNNLLSQTVTSLPFTPYCV